MKQDGIPHKKHRCKSANTLWKYCQGSILLKYPDPMAIENILAQIDSEIERLKQARTLLATIGISTKTRGAARKAAAKAKPRKKRVLSADARKRIADAQRKRWAEHRKKLGAKG